MAQLYRLTATGCFASDGGPVDTKQLTCQGRLRFQILMDLLRLAFEIRIELTGNDAFVLLLLMVQAHEVLAVQRQDGPPVATGLLQNLHVSHSLSGSARLSNRQHVVSQLPERLDHGQGEVFVRVQAGHLRLFILTDLVLDLLAV